MHLLVWTDDWQQQCCGDAVAVGAVVEWLLHTGFSAAWMSELLGPELGPRVTHVEDHHDVGPATTTSVRGTVVRIRAVSCRWEPDPTKTVGTARPVPGATRFDDQQDLDPWFAPPAPLSLRGFLVDLDAVPG